MELSELAAYAEEQYHIHEQFRWPAFPGFSELRDPESGKSLAFLMREWDTDTGTEIQRCDIRCGQACLAEYFVPYLTRPFRMKGAGWVGVIMDGGTEPAVVRRLFDRAVADEQCRGCTIVLESRPFPSPCRETPLPFRSVPLAADEPELPAQIRGMRALYEYGDGSFPQKAKNFCRQGKYMENYEDDAPWNGAFLRYFPTYHDLNTRQLRGYFSWRTALRRGEFRPIATSLAYLYVYELLCGIGCGSVEDRLQKLRAFEEGFVLSGVGDSGMDGNLRRWMLELAVVHGLPPETARSCASPSLLERDAALDALRSPDEHTDEEVFSALCLLGGSKLAQSAAVTKAARGRALFAALWRSLSRQGGTGRKGLFVSLFGEQELHAWYPLANAVYWEEREQPDTVYTLTPCRQYRCTAGFWEELRYERSRFRHERLEALLHEADRQLRQYLHVGRPLREKKDGDWVKPRIAAFLEEDRRAQLEAARPKLTLDPAGLERIRRNASVTRDWLLTEDEALEPEAPAETAAAVCGLDSLHTAVLAALLRGEAPTAQLNAAGLPPAVVADTINEAFYDELGDSVLECDGSALRLVEDYREELARILGGTER